jgi:DNA-damage-inducible protein D
MSETIRQLDSVKRTASTGGEYWMARDVMATLGYANWANFLSAIDRARASCAASGVGPENHFAATNKMVEIGMNGDAAKPEIADAQRYFAIQTRNNEIANQLSDDESRCLLEIGSRMETKDLVARPKRRAF